MEFETLHINSTIEGLVGFGPRSYRIKKGVTSKYYMAQAFKSCIDRDNSFFPRCVIIPLFFFILVNDIGRGEEN